MITFEARGCDLLLLCVQRNISVDLVVGSVSCHLTKLEATLMFSINLKKKKQFDRHIINTLLLWLKFE